MPGKPVLVMQTGDTASAIIKRFGNFDAMFLRTAGLSPADVRVVNVHRGETPESASSYSAAIVTGSPAMVTDNLPWSVAAGEWLARALDAGLPLFCVCYGHQLLAQALGGEVDYHPEGGEVGSYDVTLTEAGARHPLFRDMPATFGANLAHSQSVTRLPAGALLLAGSALDPNQAAAYGDRSVSMQFHPEFDAAITDAYLDLYSRYKPELADHYQALKRHTRESPEAAGLLRRFLAAR